jgi:predicted phage-related endonuclease
MVLTSHLALLTQGEIMIPATQLQPQRPDYYGSADIAALLKIEGAFGSEYSVFDRKVNGSQSTESVYMTWGSRLEDDILEAYEAEEGTGELVSLQAHYACPRWDKARATLDAVARVGGELIAVEAKSSGDWGWDEVPLNYEAQVQWQLGCSGLKRAHLVVWFRSTCKLKVFDIRFSESVFNQMLETVQKFDEQYVMTGTPPPADGHPSTTECLQRIRGNGQVAEIDQLEGDVKQLADLKEAIKALEDQEAEVTNRIKAALGENEKGMIGGEVVVTWGSRTTTRFDQKKFREDHADLASQYLVTSTYRDGLRLKKVKEGKNEYRNKAITA